MSLCRGGSKNSVSDPIVTETLPPCCSTVEPTASSSDSTASHSMLWLTGCWRAGAAYCGDDCSGAAAPIRLTLTLLSVLVTLAEAEGLPAGQGAHRQRGSRPGTAWAVA